MRQKKAPLPLLQAITSIAFSLVLLGAGWMLMSAGANAFRERYWTISVPVARILFGGPFGVLKDHDAIVRTWEGPPAQVAGTGLISLGLLFTLWAGGVVWGAWPSRPPVPSEPSTLKPWPGPLSIVSTVLFSAAIVLMFPPWTLKGSIIVTWFWASALAWIVTVLVLVRNRSVWATRWIVFLVFLLTLLCDTFISLSNSGGPLAGMVAALGWMGHALYVYPPWRQWAINRAAAPRHEAE